MDCFTTHQGQFLYGILSFLIPFLLVPLNLGIVSFTKNLFVHVFWVVIQIGSAVGGIASAFYGFNHGMIVIIFSFLFVYQWVDYFLNATCKFII